MAKVSSQRDTKKIKTKILLDVKKQSTSTQVRNRKRQRKNSIKVGIT